MEGQIFNDADKFAMGLENMKFNKGSGYYSNALSAVMYAAQLPFRVGVTKTIVLAR